MAVQLRLPPPMTKKKLGIYVGVKQVFNGRGLYLYTKMEIFRSEEKPDEEKVKGLFNLVWGPFKTIRGAKARMWLAFYGNPYYCDVAECEKLGRENVAELAKKERERIRM